MLFSDPLSLYYSATGSIIISSDTFQYYTFAYLPLAAASCNAVINSLPQGTFTTADADSPHFFSSFSTSSIAPASIAAINKAFWWHKNLNVTPSCANESVIFCTSARSFQILATMSSRSSQKLFEALAFMLYVVTLQNVLFIWIKKQCNAINRSRPIIRWMWNISSYILFGTKWVLAVNMISQC